MSWKVSASFPSYFLYCNHIIFSPAKPCTNECCRRVCGRRVRVEFARPFDDRGPSGRRQARPRRSRGLQQPRYSIYSIYVYLCYLRASFPMKCCHLLCTSGSILSSASYNWLLFYLIELTRLLCEHTKTTTNLELNYTIAAIVPSEYLFLLSSYQFWRIALQPICHRPPSPDDDLDNSGACDNQAYLKALTPSTCNQSMVLNYHSLLHLFHFWL